MFNALGQGIQRVTTRLDKIIHYVIGVVPPDQLGSTKLAKMLWFADVEHYRLTGHTLSHADEYKKKDQGPLHADFYGAVDRLKKSGAIADRSSQTWAGVRREFLWLTQPDMTEFNGQELATLHSVIEQIRPLTAKQASDLSHVEPWHSAYHNERLPVAAAAVQFGEVDEDDLAWAEAAFDAVRPPS
jgi:uncharacterized phage-associated protein